MDISVMDISSLTYEEMLFIFSMLRKYGNMPDPSIKNRKKRIKSSKIPNTKYPDLYDLKCPKWKQCEDKHFLYYRMIMEKIITND